jgi:hypothetical protein
MSRLIRVVIMAVVSATLVVQMAVPSFAARNYGGEAAEVSLSIAEINHNGILLEGAPSSTDNVTCSIPNWSAVNQQAADIPGVIFVYGRDIAEGTLVCNDTDAITGGAPVSFDTFLDITIEAYNPYNNQYERVVRRWCTGTSMASQSTIVCQMSHDYLNRNDEHQLWYRRAIFEGGVFVNGEREIRSVRAFGPLSPSAVLVAQDEVL